MIDTKKTLVLGFKLAITVLATVLVLEAVLRLYNRINPTFILPAATYQGFRGRPFAKDYDSRLNSRGFKDAESSLQKKPGVFRILAIGDSFCFGVVPYRYNFLTLLEQRLNQAGKPAEVINMGIPGAGVKSYLTLLNNEGLKTCPDMVICFFFIGNDFLDEIERNNRSFLYAFIKYVSSIVFKARGTIPQDNQQYDDNAAFFSPQYYLKIERLRSRVFLKRNPFFAYQLSQVVLHLKKINDICAVRNIRFLTVVITDELQLNPVLQSEVIASFNNLNKDDFDFGLPNRQLHLVLAEQGVESLDLLEDFVRVAKEKRLYKPCDTHWNIAGNGLAAELIFEKLKDTGKF
jgi:hypothetical protein